LSGEEAGCQPGQHDPSRCPQLAPGQAQLAPVRRGRALLCLERGLGLLHLADERVETHGGVTSMPRPFFTGLSSVASATASAASSPETGAPASGIMLASSPTPRRASWRRVALKRVCSK